MYSGYFIRSNKLVTSSWRLSVDRMLSGWSCGRWVPSRNQMPLGPPWPIDRTLYIGISRPEVVRGGIFCHPWHFWLLIGRMFFWIKTTCIITKSKLSYIVPVSTVILYLVPPLLIFLSIEVNTNLLLGSRRCYLFVWSTRPPYFKLEVSIETDYQDIIDDVAKFYLHQFLPLAIEIGNIKLV